MEFLLRNEVLTTVERLRMHTRTDIGQHLHINIHTTLH